MHTNQKFDIFYAEKKRQNKAQSKQNTYTEKTKLAQKNARKKAFENVQAWKVKKIENHTLNIRAHKSPNIHTELNKKQTKTHKHKL